jgi:hypothetical protein
MANEAVLELITRLRVEMVGEFNKVLDQMEKGAKRAKETQTYFKEMTEATSKLGKELSSGLSPALAAFGITSAGVAASVYGLMNRMTEFSRSALANRATAAQVHTTADSLHRLGSAFEVLGRNRDEAAGALDQLSHIMAGMPTGTREIPLERAAAVMNEMSKRGPAMRDVWREMVEFNKTHPDADSLEQLTKLVTVASQRVKDPQQFADLMTLWTGNKNVSTQLLQVYEQMSHTIGATTEELIKWGVQTQRLKDDWNTFVDVTLGRIAPMLDGLIKKTDDWIKELTTTGPEPGSFLDILDKLSKGEIWSALRDISKGAGKAQSDILRGLGVPTSPLTPPAGTKSWGDYVKEFLNDMWEKFKQEGRNVREHPLQKRGANDITDLLNQYAARLNPISSAAAAEMARREFDPFRYQPRQGVDALAETDRMALLAEDARRRLDLEKAGQFNRAKLVRWYWNGVFGELYGSAVESRIARDFLEVPPWLRGGDLPTTIRDATFRAERLQTMRMRLSAAYKGVNALLMKEGAQDFRSGQKFDHIVFFGEDVDIHHIFPKKWCEDRKIKPEVYDSIINKTPLAYRTNRIVGGAAPSSYLAKLESGDEQTPAIPFQNLDRYLESHLIAPRLLRVDSFDAFMKDRQAKLLQLIEQATGQAAYRGDAPADEAETDAETAEAALTMAA